MPPKGLASRHTFKGVKPKGKVQCGSVSGEASPDHLPWQFKANYLYGVVEPATGEHFFYEFTHFNTDCFQVFLNLVSQQYSDSIVIIQLDQAGCHRAKRLEIPPNIILMFQPSHAPETNPIERVWLHLKQNLRWKLPKNLDELKAIVTQMLQENDPKSHCFFDGESIHPQGFICSWYLRNWHNSSDLICCHPSQVFG